MEIPLGLFYLSALFFAAMVVVTFFRAYRERERISYVVVVLCLLGFIWSILFVLGHVPLAGLFWVVAMMVSVFMRPELRELQDRQMREVDVKSPLRLGKLFSNTHSEWLKLAYRHGLGVTVILFFLQFEVIAMGLLNRRVSPNFKPISQTGVINVSERRGQGGTLGIKPWQVLDQP